MSLLSVKFNPSKLTALTQYAIVLIVSFIFILIMDMLSIEITQMEDYPFGDHQIYMNMVEEGVPGNPDLVTPFAFRYGFTELVAVIRDFTNLSLYHSFKVVTYASLLIQSILIFALTQKITPDVRIGFAILAIAGFSFFNLRYNIHDPIRPDPLSFAVILFVFLLIYYDRIFLAALVAIAGLSIREFMVAPLAGITFLYLWDFHQTRKPTSIVKIVIIAVLSAIMIFVPRILIPVAQNYTFIHEPVDILNQWLDVLRILNFFIASTGQLLPVILLMTDTRWQAIKEETPGLALIIVPYVVLVALLGIYGGTDVARFASYLYVPMIVLLAIMLRVEFNVREVVYVIASWFVYFRYWQNFPTELDSYLIYVGPFFNHITLFAPIRLVIIALALYGMIYIRRRRAKNEDGEA